VENKDNKITIRTTEAIPPPKVTLRGSGKRIPVNDKSVSVEKNHSLKVNTEAEGHKIKKIRQSSEDFKGKLHVPDPQEAKNTQEEKSGEKKQVKASPEKTVVKEETKLKKSVFTPPNSVLQPVSKPCLQTPSTLWHGISQLSAYPS
jgi:hypothetical protein